MNREVKFCENSKQKKIEGGVGRGRGRGEGGGGPIRGWGGKGGKVWGSWVTWGMGDVNQE